MKNLRSFVDVPRDADREREIADRVHDWQEIVIATPPDEVRAQASRCLDCGVPFCHASCPLGNLVPEWNDLVSDGAMDDALDRLLTTNNFPEITSRVCPAPCESSCVLALEDDSSVTIKAVERALSHVDVERGFVPRRARARTHRSVAVVGSGPAGLAAAQQLARQGHDVTVFERDERPGGLLRYGIPDFKLEKRPLDARLAQLRAEGVVFRCNTEADARLLEPFEAVVLAIGARRARDLRVPGRELHGVALAMDFLAQQNRRIAGDAIRAEPIEATEKRVVVIGGGDTGSDCVGTAIRQGAASVLQLEIMPKPPLVRAPRNPWPEWPLVFRTTSSQEEGAERDFALMTVALRGNTEAHITSIEGVRVERAAGAFRAVDAEPIVMPCDLAVIAMGFEGPETSLAAQLGVALDARGNIAIDERHATNVPHVFAAGDASRGQSLVVWAIADGRRAAASVSARLAHGDARSRAS